MDILNFSLMQIIVERRERGERFTNLDYNLCISLPPTAKFIDSKGTYYDVTIDKTNTSHLWLSFEYGRPSPRDENLTNVRTGEKTINERTADEAELLGQLFLLYHYDTKTLYLSDIRKKKIVEQFLIQYLQVGITIKSFYKSIDEIRDLLKSVSCISFTSIKDLFNADSLERKALIDLTGTDAPEKFKIEAKYKSSTIFPFITKLRSAKEEGQLKDLVIRGTDENDMSIVSNIDSFTRKVEIFLLREDSGKFNPQKVQNELIKQILR